MSTTALEHDQAVAQLEELVNRRRLAPARNVLASALPQYPDSVDLLQYAAWVDWLDDDLDGATASIDRILKIEPTHFDARSLLSVIQSEQGRYGEAEQTILELLREYPENAELYARYGTLMLNTFHIDKAQRLAAEALRRDPNNRTALNVDVVCAFIRSPGAEHRARLQRLLKEYPDQAESTIRVVQLLLDRGKQREAYELSRELVQADPTNEPLVELASQLRRASHWSLLPLWPMQKWGWAGSIGIWFIAIVLLRSNVLESTPLAGYVNVIGIAFLAYVIYSWVWPPLLKRILR